MVKYILPADVAERQTHLTQNQTSTPRAGSNPAIRIYIVRKITCIASGLFCILLQ